MKTIHRFTLTLLLAFASLSLVHPSSSAQTGTVAPATPAVVPIWFNVSPESSYVTITMPIGTVWRMSNPTDGKICNWSTYTGTPIPAYYNNLPAAIRANMPDCDPNKPKGVDVQEGPVSFTVTEVNKINTVPTTTTITVPALPQAAPVAPVITWPTPSAIQLGMALSADQLNATANTPGTFIYTPPLGALPPVGSTTLTASFLPADPVHFTAANASVSLTVTAPPIAPPALTLTITGPTIVTPIVLKLGGTTGWCNFISANDSGNYGIALSGCLMPPPAK